jgi:hypothetical protein
VCLITLQVCQWVFGQEFPGPESPVSQQAFAVVTAMVGLCAFALVLALVEQVVLEGMEANVKRGSRVYETGHVSACITLQVVSSVAGAAAEVMRRCCQQLHAGKVAAILARKYACQATQGLVQLLAGLNT